MEDGGVFGVLEQYYGDDRCHGFRRRKLQLPDLGPIDTVKRCDVLGTGTPQDTLGLSQPLISVDADVAGIHYLEMAAFEHIQRSKAHNVDLLLEGNNRPEIIDGIAVGHYLPFTLAAT